MTNVRFDDLRIEESPRLVSHWIHRDVWSRDAQRGRIDGVSFRRINAQAEADVTRNIFVRNATVLPIAPVRAIHRRHCNRE